MTAAAVEDMRQGVVDLTTLARAEVAALKLETMTPEQARDALLYAVPQIARKYGLAAGALTADWYDELRFLAGVGGRFRATPAELPTPERFEKLVVWALDPLFRVSPTGDVTLDPREVAKVKLEGGLQRIIANQHRYTVMDATNIDPASKGWRRIGRGETCGFCRMLISRGAVYTGRSVTFRSHDNCNCAAQPVWDEHVEFVSGEPFRQSQRRRSAATKAQDNERAYRYIADTFSD